MAHDDDVDIPPFLDRRNKPAPSGLESTAAANIPALIVRSAARLMQAKSSAEVLEAKGLAQAALHYARVTKAANETHADCLRIITRAECRMANEVDAAQERGELAKPGRPGKIVRTADNLDLDRRRVEEWRDVRDAGEQFVEDVLLAALAEGRTPTKREIINGAKAVRQELEGRGENPHVTKREDTKGRHQPANKRTKRASQRKRLIGVHWEPDATSAAIVHGLLAKLAGHSQHLALCKVLRTFLNEHVAR